MEAGRQGLLPGRDGGDRVGGGAGPLSAIPEAPVAPSPLVALGWVDRSCRGTVQIPGLWAMGPPTLLEGRVVFRPQGSRLACCNPASPGGICRGSYRDVLLSAGGQPGSGSGSERTCVP